MEYCKTVFEAIESLKNDNINGITFINSSNSEVFISYKKLYSEAKRTLYIMDMNGIKPKDEVILQLDDNREYVTFLWACILGGVIPVPISLGRNKELRAKTFKVWKCLNNPFMITTIDNLNRLKRDFDEKVSIIKDKIILSNNIINRNDINIEDKACYESQQFTVCDSDIAFLQFTSGSTGDPKGVILTHKNLAVNIYDMIKVSNINKDDSMLGWQPITHDMGLILFHFTAVFAGINFYLMPTSLFIRNPILWLEKANEHRASILGSPNFGYKYFLKCFKDSKVKWDLSCIRIIYNGAEPISSAICKNFFEKLAKYKLKSTTLVPSYGLAEASVGVSLSSPEQAWSTMYLDRKNVNIGEKIVETTQEDLSSIGFVRLGAPLEHCSVRITNNNFVLGENTIGYVEIKGNNVTSGYYNNYEATSKLFTSDAWLKTKDIGFISNNHIYIIGRAKDMFFVNGQNYYSHDIERILEEIEGIELGKIVVSGFSNARLERDEIVAFTVYKKSDWVEFRKLCNRIRKQVSINAGISIDNIVPVKQIPKTSSGKIQRFKLVEKYKEGAYESVLNDIELVDVQSTKAVSSTYSLTDVISILRNSISGVLGFEVMDLNVSIMEMGLVSLKIPELVQALEAVFKVNLPVSLVMDYPTINKMADYIYNLLGTSYFSTQEKNYEQNEKNMRENDKIAIVGIGCRFPGGADSPEKFWENLCNGVNAISEIPNNRWNINEYYNPSSEAVGKISTKYGGFLRDIRSFDGEFFGITPVEAQELDPQQRILLEVAWESFENAGLDIVKYEGSNTGVFLGISNSDYASLKGNEELNSYSLTGTMLSTAAGRISYTFGFKGPNFVVDTACSSSLVAVHEAVSSLRFKKCDVALAGGINLIISPKIHIGLSRLNVLSPDGQCKTFDNSADGYGRGEGCGLVVLKRYEDALKDRDNIFAVISGSAVNHDGRSSGLTVPNGLAQEEVIKSAMQEGNTNDVDYIEAHGTGTKLGDPQEVEALSRVFAHCSQTNPLLIGSVKTNIGHLESAAGVAGLIKLVLSLYYKKIPKQLHYNNPNKLIKWDSIPIKVVDNTIEWKLKSDKRRGGISSFGLSGTNAHIVLEEASNKTSVEQKNEFSLLTISAKSEKALKDLAVMYCKYLEKTKDSINDICFTTNISRASLEYPLGLVGSSKESILSQLRKWLIKFENGKIHANKTSTNSKRIVYMFSGQGSQHFGIGKELYKQLPYFKKTMDECNRAFSKYLDVSIISVLYGEKDSYFHHTIYYQATLFSIQYSLSQVWLNLGVEPSAVIGHSIGEYTAACIAGIVNLEDVAYLIIKRGKLINQLTQEGAMAIVYAEESLVQKEIEDYSKKVSIATSNSKFNTVISGDKVLVMKLLNSFAQKGFKTKLLPMSIAFHSPLMKCIQEDFYACAKTIEYKNPVIPFFSGIKGQYMLDGEVNGLYWTQHLTESVKFTKSIEFLAQENESIFIEIGPSSSLSVLGEQNAGTSSSIFIPSIQKGVEIKTILSSIAEIYMNGQGMKLENLFHKRNYKKIILPNYSFDRKQYWLKRNEKTSISDYELENVHEYKRLSEVAPEMCVSNSKKDGSIDELNIERITSDLKEIISNITGIEEGKVSDSVGLFSLGLDSLMISRLQKNIYSDFDVDMQVRDLYTEYNTIEKIAQNIASNKRNYKEHFTMCEEAVTKEDISIENNNITDNESFDLNDIIKKQLNVMEKQLEMCQAFNTKSQNKAPLEINRKVENSRKNIAKQRTLNIRSMKFEQDILNKKQSDFVKQFIKKYNNKTNKSKKYAGKNRANLADWINSLNFRRSLKEIVYPIVSDGSKGSKFWDVDGNEYIDLAMGYGVNFFGHNPEFIVEAIQKQLVKGMELAPQAYLAGKVAGLVCELTGSERVSFANTGSEAVMEALRIARTVTKRNKIVKFSGSYHGNSDIVLADADELGNYPSALGITQGAVEDVIVMDYGSKDTLNELKNLGSEIAAVLVEPIQSRRPGFQPKEFLHQLRLITEDIGAVLIFDEMITGFRCRLGGVQEYFGIKADIVLYGKIVGGGMPIGIIAGKKEYLDAVDGGMWNYNDESAPTKDTTFIAGTFCKHPLALSSSFAVLSHMKKEGTKLQESVNRKTALFAMDLNDFFEKEDIAIRIKYFASQFRFESFGEYDLAFMPIEMELLFYLLMYKGVYTWERRICFFSAMHTQDDIDLIIKKVKESIFELRQGGFFSNAVTQSTALTRSDFPMSSVQKRLFTLAMLEGGERAYHIIGALSISGKLDILRTEEIFKKLVSRHSALRTSFELQGECFLQKTHEDVDFEVVTIRAGKESIENTIKGLIKPFNLSIPPLMNIGIIEKSQESYILIMDFHHIVVDGYSLEVLFRDFIALYRGEDLSLLKTNYQNYVEWEQEYLCSEKAEEDEKFWLEQFSDYNSRLNLPTDFAPPSIVSFNGASVKFQFDKEITAKLKKLARKTDTSLYMVLLSIYATLLHKLTLEKDIVIGSPTTARDVGDFERNVGMYINTVALRFEIEERESFSYLLQSIKDTFSKALSHQYYPFDLLIDKLGRGGDGSQNPLFATTFGYENADNRVLEIETLKIQPYNIENSTTMFDITFDVIEEQGNINIEIIYNSDLFKNSTINRWSKMYKKITEQVLDNCDISVCELEIIDDMEKQIILNDFNNTRVIYDESLLFIELFEEQVVRTPKNTALQFRNNSLKHLENYTHNNYYSITYEQLNNRANHLAGVLQNNSINEDSLVGILMDRSPEMVVSILAIWKAGGAYIPLDPEYPVQRICDILSDAKAQVLLSTASVINSKKYSFKQLINLYTIIYLDINNDLISDERYSNLKNNAKPSSLAYVIYTSGSTGHPKGVMVEHMGMLNHMFAKINELKIEENSVIAQNASQCFDISVWQFFAGLIVGGTTIIYSNDIVLEPRKFIELLEQDNITILEVVPSYLNVLLEQLDSRTNDLTSLQYILITGEELKAKLVNRWFSKYSHIKMVNAYGPTEASDDITHFIMDKPIDTQSVSIGRPVQNLSIYIVDSYMKLCPIGVKGEICVAGIGVGRGYLNDSIKTQAVFVENPYSIKKGVRLYKTGDIGCWNDDGTIRFFGRKDAQVKIRGFRIEIDEIESKIMKNHKIKEAVVITQNDMEGNQYLCCYYTCKNFNSFNSQKLKDYLAGELPGYMIPEYLIEIEEFKLTSNGKINRKLLPKPDFSIINAFTPPSSKTELELVEIYKDILGLDKLGVLDSFFNLGGHSIKAIRLVKQIFEELQISLTLTDIFKNPSVRELAEYIDSCRRQDYVSIVPCEAREYYPVSSVQKGIFALSHLDKTGLNYNVAGAIVIDGDIKKTKIEEIFNAIALRHEPLRTSFHTLEDGSIAYRINKDCNISISIEDVFEDELEKVINLFIRPFDLTKVPLIHIKLIKVIRINNKTEKITEKSKKTRFLLLLDLHHLICDGFSLDILIKEFICLYKGKELDNLDIQYKDYVCWKEEFLKTQQGKKHKHYWCNQFKDSICELQLPLDFPRPLVQKFEGDTITLYMNKEMTKKVFDIALKNNITPFMVLLTSYKILLSKYASQYDIVVGIPVAGRNHPDIQNLIGLFINVLPLRTFPDPNKKVFEFIGEVKDCVLGAFENDSYPFEELVEVLNIKRKANRNPLFDTMFAFQNIIMEESIDINDNVTIQPQHIDNPSTIHDLFFEVTELVDTFCLRLKYSTSLFKKETVEKILDNYLEILNQIEEGKKLLKDINIEIHSLNISSSNLFTDEEEEFDF